jgi:hypothetical protein
MPATDVRTAYLDTLRAFDREVWSDPAPPYVPRTTAQDGLLRPQWEKLKEFLLVEDVEKFVLTGQKGAGKSVELYELRRALQGHREVVVVDASERLNLYREVDIRFVLVAIAEALVERILEKDPGFARAFGRASNPGDAIREWARILRNTGIPDVPSADKVDGREFMSKVGEALSGVSVKARSDDQLRESLKSGDVSQVAALVTLLADQLAALSRPVVVIVDDLDKIADPASWRHVYHDHLETLRRLPFRWVVTMPFALRYETFAVRAETLNNVKVVERGAPGVVLPAASGFFGEIAAKHIDLGLVDSAVLDGAARLSAGIPREFLRILWTAFGVAHQLREARVLAAHLREAEIQLRRDLQPFHADPRVALALELVRIRPQRLDAAQRQLLANLLIVEYSNEVQWYDVNPLLTAEYDKLLAERARRLGTARDDADALVAEIEARLAK